MKLTFDNLTVEEGWAIMNAVAGKSIINAGARSTEDALLSEDEPLQKPRRRRRSKAEMAEARNEEAQAAEEADAHPEEEPPRRRRRRAVADEAEPASQGEDDPPTSRRRRRRPATEEDNPKPKRHRFTGKQGSSHGDTVDEITDRDVSKAASDGAQELTPAAVRGILDQFGVANVGDLDQEQRCEFIDMVEQAVEDADLDGDD